MYGEKEKDEVEPLVLLQKYPGLCFRKIPFLKRRFNPFPDMYAFLHILVILFKFKPHIIHTHGAKSGFTGRLAAWLSRTPVIIHTYHGHFFHSYFSKKTSALIAFAERIIGKVTTAVITLSNLQKIELADQFKILPASKIVVIELGFDFDESINHEAKRENFRSRYNLQKSDIAVGIVGRIVPVKNHSFFVEVIDNILSHNSGNNPVFFIIGDGNLRTQVEKELFSKNISFTNKAIDAKTRVVFTSWLTDVYEVMSGLDIVVQTSLNEGTPLAVIEAGFLKKPVVCTDVGGVGDCVQDGVTGFLCKKNDILGFSNKLRLLISNENLRNKMGQAGKKFAAVKFSKQKEVTLIKELYFAELAKKNYFFTKNTKDN